MNINLNWNQLSLFEIETIENLDILNKEGLSIGNGNFNIGVLKTFIILSNFKNKIYIFEKKNKVLKLVKKINCYNSEYIIKFIGSLEESEHFFTIGEKQGCPLILRVWDLNSFIISKKNSELINNDKTKDQENTFNINDIEIIESKFEFEITNNIDTQFVSCFSYKKSFLQFLIGYSNGDIVLIEGDFNKEKSFKQKLIEKLENPITNISFDNTSLYFFVTTRSELFCYELKSKNQKKKKDLIRKEDNLNLSCSEYFHSKNNFIVGTDKTLKFFDNTSMVNEIDLNFHKEIIKFFSSRYLLIVSQQKNNSTTKSLTYDSTIEEKYSCVIIILDLIDIHISFNLTITNDSINNVFLFQNDFFLVSNEGTFYFISEKSIDDQINVFMNHNLFQKALNMSVHNNLDISNNFFIQKKHADYLFIKDDYDGSIKKYAKCLNCYVDNEKKDFENLKLSLNEFIIYVIEKFKNISELYYLSIFLRKLYNLNLANEDHIILLICCYCKLTSSEEFDDFIDISNLEKDTKISELNFYSIFELLKDSKHQKQIFRFLQKLNLPRLIVDIKLYNDVDFQDILDYIKTTNIVDLLLIINDHSETFMNFNSIETTKLLISVFTGCYIPNKLCHNFQNKKNINSNQNDQNQFFSKFSYDKYLFMKKEIKSSDNLNKNFMLNSKYLPPKPNLVFSSFICYYVEFVIFLESCFKASIIFEVNNEDKKEILTRLLETILQLSRKDETKSNPWHDKAKKLVNENFSFFDINSLKLLFYIYKFDYDYLFLSEDEEILFSNYELCEDIDKCMDIIKNVKNVSLYLQMFNFIISKEQITERVSKEDFIFILEKIKEHSLLSPLEIILSLTKTENKFITLKLVKEYLLNLFDNQNKDIKNNSILLNYYQTEASKNKKTLLKLTNKYQIINNTKCSICQNDLSYPIIHFKCDHSFHLQCLDSNVIISPSTNDQNSKKKKCIICIVDHDEFKSNTLNTLKSYDDFDLFKKTLDEKKDKFKFIIECVSKNVLGNNFSKLLNF